MDGGAQDAVDGLVERGEGLQGRLERGLIAEGGQGDGGGLLDAGQLGGDGGGRDAPRRWGTTGGPEQVAARDVLAKARAAGGVDERHQPGLGGRERQGVVGGVPAPRRAGRQLARAGPRARRYRGAIRAELQEGHLLAVGDPLDLHRAVPRGQHSHRDLEGGAHAVGRRALAPVDEGGWSGAAGSQAAPPERSPVWYRCTSTDTGGSASACPRAAAWAAAAGPTAERSTSRTAAATSPRRRPCATGRSPPPRTPDRPPPRTRNAPRTAPHRARAAAVPAPPRTRPATPPARSPPARQRPGHLPGARARPGWRTPHRPPRTPPAHGGPPGAAARATGPCRPAAARPSAPGTSGPDYPPGHATVYLARSFPNPFPSEPEPEPEPETGGRAEASVDHV